MSGFRLSNLGERRPIRFTFNGKTYHGQEGDTLASALIANGISTVARSFKYHRPRGIFSAGSEEPSALVTLHKGARTEPNIRATEIELYDGLEARPGSWLTAIRSKSTLGQQFCDRASSPS